MIFPSRITIFFSYLNLSSQRSKVFKCHPIYATDAVPNMKCVCCSIYGMTFQNENGQWLWNAIDVPCIEDMLLMFNRCDYSHCLRELLFSEVQKRLRIRNTKVNHLLFLLNLLAASIEKQELYINFSELYSKLYIFIPVFFWHT